MKHRIIVATIVALSLFALTVPVFAMDVEALFVGVVEDREQDGNLVYAFVVSLFGEDIAGGRVLRPGNPTPICDLDFDATYLSFDATCNILGTSYADLCSQFGFGDFIVEIDAAVGSDDTVTVFFDQGCADAFSGNVDVTSPATGASVPPIPGPNSFCFDCSVPGDCGGLWQMELSDDFGNLGVADFLEQPPVPGCWDPGVCLPQQSNYEFRISALEIFEDSVPRSTNLGDDFSQTAFFQNANLDYFDVTAPAPTTPSAVSPGIGGAIPMFVVRQAPDASVLDIIWDELACCGNADSHLVYGTGADLPNSVGGSFQLGGSQCAIGTDGVYTWNSVPAPPLGEFIWWLVLNNDAVVTEGSWGLDSAGQERNGPGAGGISAQCGMTTKSLANACGR